MNNFLDCRVKPKYIPDISNKYVSHVMPNWFTELKEDKEFILSTVIIFI